MEAPQEIFQDAPGTMVGRAPSQVDEENIFPALLDESSEDAQPKCRCGEWLNHNLIELLPATRGLHKAKRRVVRKALSEAFSSGS